MSWKNAQRNRVVAAGTYHTQVKDWKEYKAKSGNDCIIVEHTIIGPTEGVGSEEIGQKVSDFITLTEKSAWKLGWFVSSCGISTENLPDMDTASEDFLRILNTCKGRKLWITVSKEVYDGADVNKVVDYMPDDDQEAVDVVDEVPEYISRKMKKG